MEPNDILALTRQSLDVTATRVADLVASAPDLSALAYGCEWSLQQVAAHLIAETVLNTDIVNGAPGPFESADPTYLRAASERLIAEVPETDPVKLSRLLLDAVERFLGATAERPGEDPLTFHLGLPFTVGGVASVYLGELVLHGYDMAGALGRPWPIDPLDAQLILAGYGPVFALMVHPERTRGLSAGIAIEMRGGASMTMRFTDGVFGLEPAGAGPLDATISADPVTFLMMGARRLSPYQAVALGLLSVGGDRPDLALGFPDLFAYPS